MISAFRQIKPKKHVITISHQVFVTSVYWKSSAYRDTYLRFSCLKLVEFIILDEKKNHQLPKPL